MNNTTQQKRYTVYGSALGGMVFLYFLISLCLIPYTSLTQNIGINTTGAAPVASALLDVDASPGNDKGILIPRVALTQTTSNSPIGGGIVESLLVYNTATFNDVTPGFYYWNGSVWVRLLNYGTNFCSSAAANYIAKFTSASGICNSIIYDNGTTGIGIGNTNPNRMGNAQDRTLTIESSNEAHVELMRITSAAGADIGALNFNRIAVANGAITARACIIGETVNGTTDSRLGFYTMGIPVTLTERMTINEAGNVGIGITAPTSKLHVYHTNPSMVIGSSSQYVPALTADANTNLHASWNTVMPGSSFNINADVYGAVNRIEATSSQTGTITGAYGSTNDVYNSGTGTIAGAFGSANYVRNISTGTITNAYGLQANVTNAGTGTITNGYGILISSVEATNKYSLYSTDATAPSYFAGNVSIGTPTANARLDVKGSGNTNATYGFGVRNSSDIYSLVVSDNGYVGIGTVGYFAAPEMPLHLHSAVNNFHAIRLTAENITKYWDIIKRGNTYPQPDNFVIGYWNGGSWQEEFQITPAGNFGMGVNNPTNKLEVAGNIWATGDIYLGACGVWLSPSVCSDIRYKKDIVVIKEVLPDVMKLEGIKYYWRKDEFPDKHFDHRRQIGFIAQEMEKVFPEVVNTNDEGYKSIDYAKLTPVLVEAIKEQQKIIRDQQSAINGLQKTNDELKTSNETMKSDVEKIKIHLGLMTKADK